MVVRGEADLNFAGELNRALDDARADGSRVAVDLTAASLLDSRTIGVLAVAAEELRKTGPRLALICTQENVRRLFTTLGLEGEFDFVASRAEAFGD